MLFIGTASFQMLRFSNANLSIKYHDQKFYIKVAFSGQHWTGLSIEKFKNSVFGVLLKISFSLLNQLKKTTIYYLLLLLAFYSPKNNESHHCNEKLAPQQAFYYNWSISRFGIHFDNRPKILTCRQLSLNFFLLTNCPMKITVS